MSLENPCTILLAKEKTWKRTFNIDWELPQNGIEKQILLWKTTVNRLYVMLFSNCFFDWKIGVFQQTSVRVYCILNRICKNYQNLRISPPMLGNGIFIRLYSKVPNTSRSERHTSMLFKQPQFEINFREN